MSGHGGAADRVSGTVVSVNYQGADTRIAFDVAGTRITVLSRDGGGTPGIGETLGLTWDNSAVHVMEDQS